MLSASATVLPKTSVRKLSFVWIFTAPPVAVLATKSSEPPSRTGLVFRHVVVFGSE